jgi:hypothetical protein
VIEGVATRLTGHRKRMSQQRLLGQTVSNPISRRRHARPHPRARSCWFQQALDLGCVRWKIAGDNIDIKDASPGRDVAAGERGQSMQMQFAVELGSS